MREKEREREREREREWSERMGVNDRFEGREREESTLGTPWLAPGEEKDAFISGGDMLGGEGTIRRGDGDAFRIAAISRSRFRNFHCFSYDILCRHPHKRDPE